MNDAEIRTLLKQGWIRAIVTFEVAGKPKQHVADALGQYIENIKKDATVRIIQEAREDPIEHEDGIWSTYSESEMLVKGLETFTWLCINFSPASIEILEPDELKVEARDIGNWLNDLLAKIHDVSADYRNQAGAKEHLTIAMNQLIKNAILLSIRDGPKTKEAIAKDTGIYAEQLEPFFEHMTKKGTIIQVQEKYKLP